MQCTHSASEMDQTSPDDHMFTYVHSTQEDGWRPVKAAIVTHTNFFSTQQEQEGITLLNERMTVTSLL